MMVLTSHPAKHANNALLSQDTQSARSMDTLTRAEHFQQNSTGKAQASFSHLIGVIFSTFNAYAYTYE